LPAVNSRTNESEIQPGRTVGHFMLRRAVSAALFIFIL
jgi:hypothetical protein